MTDHPRIRRRMPAYPPISSAGYDGIRKYLKVAIAHDADPNIPAPDIELLRQGLPQGSILAITPDLGIQVNDTEEGLCSPQLLDALGIALVRALILPGGSVGLNTKNMNLPNRRDYLNYYATVNGRSVKVSMLRIIADTQPGYQTPSADDRLSYRRGDLPAHTGHVSSRQMTLDGTPTKFPHRGRKHALAMALHRFDKKRDKLGFPISKAEYVYLLKTILSLLDKIPLKGMEP